MIIVWCGGGSWLSDVNGVRSAHQYCLNPDLWFYLIGFRCVRSR